VGAAARAGVPAALATRHGRYRPRRWGSGRTAAAGAGIWQAVTRRLAANGATVVVSDSHERRLTAVTKSMNHDFPAITVHGCLLDMGDLGHIDAVVDLVTSNIGPIQILVNSAAVNWPGPVFDYDVVKWHRTIAGNLTGPWYLRRRTMPIMRCLVGQQGPPERRPRMRAEHSRTQTRARIGACPATGTRGYGVPSFAGAPEEHRHRVRGSDHILFGSPTRRRVGGA
jgi:NAD(P)-dependent dehydrogenase (short-subunit alcohol dehydrogenase family)